MIYKIQKNSDTIEILKRLKKKVQFFIHMQGLVFHN